MDPYGRVLDSWESDGVDPTAVEARPPEPALVSAFKKFVWILLTLLVILSLVAPLLAPLLAPLRTSPKNEREGLQASRLERAAAALVLNEPA